MTNDQISMTKNGCVLVLGHLSLLCELCGIFFWLGPNSCEFSYGLISGSGHQVLFRLRTWATRQVM
jgi:hypothetical protein